MALLGLASPAVLHGQNPQVPPPTPPSAGCTSEDHRAFDFWIGEWDVFTPAGEQAGSNTIELVMGGCVLHEHYTTPRGYEGESLNTWDASRGVWHQTWVDNGGVLLVLEGTFHPDRGMVLEGVTVGPDGAETLNRISWTVEDESGDRVRQRWSVSTDGGESWTVGFDGEYRRR
jgi:hypothetical protein